MQSLLICTQSADHACQVNNDSGKDWFDERKPVSRKRRTAIVDLVLSTRIYGQELCHGLPENHTFMAYETKGARWRPLRVALPPDLVFTEYPSLKRVWQGQVHVADVLPPVLVESNKRLLLIGYREEDSSSVCGAGIWKYVKGKWKMMSVMPDALFQQVLCPTVVVPESSYLQYSLQAAAHGELVYIFRPSSGVLLCDLAHCPPKWQCIRQNSEDWTQGCAMDLRLDTLL